MKTLAAFISLSATLPFYQTNAWNGHVIMSIVNERTAVRQGRPFKKTIGKVPKTLEIKPLLEPHIPLGWANELNILCSSENNDDGKKCENNICVLDHREHCGKRSICPFNGRECDVNQVDLFLQHQSTGKANKISENKFSTFDILSAPADGAVYLKQLANLPDTASPPFYQREQLFNGISLADQDKPWTKVANAVNMVVGLIRHLIDPFHKTC